MSAGSPGEKIFPGLLIFFDQFHLRPIARPASALSGHALRSPSPFQLTKLQIVAVDISAIDRGGMSLPLISFLHTPPKSRGGAQTTKEKIMEKFLINKAQILDALARLGELASEEGLMIQLGIVGGAVMVLEYGVRDATHDIDAIILLPEQTWKVFELVRDIAREFDWPDDWLNSDVDVFVSELFGSRSVFQAPGIEVYAASTAQMLALKLCAWRGEVDTSDAAELLKRMTGDRDEIWRKVRPFLVRGCEAVAADNFVNLWNDLYVYDDLHN